MNIGPLEIIIVIVIVLLLFGARRLPELGKGLGRGMRDFKDEITGHGDDETPPEVSAPPQAQQPPAPQPAPPEREPADRER